ncbi:hypothetical protein [Agrobacterium rosae]|uniref:DUF2730 domain-containing protein n=1 Tax=Agrobacterium rosae TaxID=1972867 RepID=A0AAW9FJK1_9HYPH|nr:hypothetical protein [Agrobacterium rosae]MDX8305599.1 hypothetical protein [Agrobacterium rosae]
MSDLNLTGVRYLSLREVGEAVLPNIVYWVPVLTAFGVAYALYDLWKTIKNGRKLRAEKEIYLAQLRELMRVKDALPDELQRDGVTSVREHLAKEMQLAIEENSRTLREFTEVVNKLQSEISRLQSELDAERAKNSGVNHDS